MGKKGERQSQGGLHANSPPPPLSCSLSPFRCTAAAVRPTDHRDISPPPLFYLEMFRKHGRDEGCLLPLPSTTKPSLLCMTKNISFLAVEVSAPVNPPSHNSDPLFGTQRAECRFLLNFGNYTYEGKKLSFMSSPLLPHGKSPDWFSAS